MATKALKTVTEKSTLVNINSPKAMAAFANDLKEFIVKQGLFTPIKNKNYVYVEGWQFAGASMGIFPMVKKVERILDEPGDNLPKNEIKYRAEVELVRLSDGQTVGYGVAICSNKEDKKKSFDEYAIASMAQTRAVGKAFRLSVGWVMKLAGYEVTPAEEAVEVAKEPEAPEMPIEDVKYLVDVKLTALSVPEKMRVLKDYAGTISDKKLTDKQYRLVYMGLSNKTEDDKPE